MIVKAVRTIVILAAATALAATDAAAAPGTVNLTTYLRAGPGNQYAVLDEIRPGAQLDVGACQDGWCRVKSDAIAGYIDAFALSAPDIHKAPPATPPAGPCVTVHLNGRPRGGDTARVCDR